MTLLIDDALWEWRGRRWCHLASDVGRQELHDIAHRLGLRRMGFQGDHYDVPAELRDRAIALGAEPVPSRSLVRRVRTAGLRSRPANRPGHWSVLASWAAGRFDLAELDRVTNPDVERQTSSLAAVAATARRLAISDWPAVETTLLARRVGVVLVVEPVGGDWHLPVPIASVRAGDALVVVHYPPHPWLMDLSLGAAPPDPIGIQEAGASSAAFGRCASLIEVIGAEP